MYIQYKNVTCKCLKLYIFYLYCYSIFNNLLIYKAKKESYVWRLLEIIQSDIFIILTNTLNTLDLGSY